MVWKIKKDDYILFEFYLLNDYFYLVLYLNFIKVNYIDIIKYIIKIN